MSSRCIEHIAYTIKPEHLQDFESIKAQVAAEAHDLPGLISSTTQRSLAADNQFVDTMIWESPEAAAAGNEAFEGLPSTPRFMSLMAGPPHFVGRFTWSAGDAALKLA